MRDIESLSDAELRSELILYKFNPGPVTGTTRSIYEKKLAKLRLSGTPTETKSNLNDSTAKRNKSKTRPVATKSPSRERKGASRSENSDESAQELESFDYGEVEEDIQIVSPSKNVKVPRKPVVSTPKKNKTPSPASSPQLSASRSKRLPNTSILSRSGKEPQTSKSILTSELDSSPKSRNISRTLTPPRRVNINQLIADRPGGTPPRSLSTWNKKTLDESLASRTLNDLGNTTGEESDGEVLETSRVFYNPKRTGSTQKAWSILGRNTETAGPLKKNAKVSVGRDVSTILMIVLSIFFLLLGMAYVATARKEVVLGTVNVLAATTRDTIGFFYTYAVLPVFLVAGAALIVVAVFFLYKRVQENQTKEEEKFQNLIEKIMDIVRESSENGEEGQYISVPHVRDIIFPPSKRTKCELKIWNRAVEFLDSSESRMSTETRVIHGQECAVWRWLPFKKTGWQGNALNNPSSPMSPSGPAYALTRSLKIREVFDNKIGEFVDFAVLRRDLTEKVYPVQPVHIGFSTEAPQGLVFMKLKNLEDSKAAFNALHSTWYNGRLLRVKYIRDSRYDERFPQ